jgi:hypothetical protein
MQNGRETIDNDRQGSPTIDKGTIAKEPQRSAKEFSADLS